MTADVLNVPAQRAAARTPRVAAVHLAGGAATLAAFLASGFYMLFLEPPVRTLPPALHGTFISRHIFILAAALIHLVLGSHLQPARTPRQRVAQWTGSAFLLLSSALLIIAFLSEPMAGEITGPFSRYGLYSLFLGALLHVGTGMRMRATA
jgi:hypothetical protein